MVGITVAFTLTAKIGNSRSISSRLAAENPAGWAVDQEHAMPSEAADCMT